MKKKILSIAAATLMGLGNGCAKTPASTTFLVSWNAAVEKKDANALWNLFDRDSRGRISTAFQKSKTRSDADQDFKRLFAGINPSVNLSQTPDEIAARAIGPQMGAAFDPHVDIRADGKDAVLTWHQQSARMQVEDGQWRARIGATGFVMPDGSPVAWAFSWPVPRLSDGASRTVGKPLPAPASGNDGGQIVESAYFETKDGRRRAILEMPDTEQPALCVVRTQKDAKGGDIAKMTEAELDDVLAGSRLGPDALGGYRVHIDPNGLTVDEMRAGYGQIAQRISKLANLPEAYAEQAARLMVYYESVIFADGPENKPYDVEFAVGLDGSLTATHWLYSRATRSKNKDVHPRLAFVALPGPP